MSAQPVNPISNKPSPTVQNGYALWNSLALVIRDTAKDNLPDDVDLKACRDIHGLAEAIERRQVSSAEDAMAAVRSILANYQRAQFADLGEATRNGCALLMRRPPGLVAMLSDPEFGIAGHERYPPTLAQFTEAAEKAEKRVLLAASGARRALGMRRSCIGDRR